MRRYSSTAWRAKEGPHAPGCYYGTGLEREPCLCRTLVRLGPAWLDAAGYRGTDLQRTQLAYVIRLIAKTDGRIEYLEAWEARTGRQRGDGYEVADLAAKNAGRKHHVAVLLGELS